MEINEFLEEMEAQYQLTELKLVGYHGGYPMIEFAREDGMKVLSMKKGEIKRIIRNCELSGGSELGVGWNFMDTAKVLIYEKTIVIAGHIYVIRRLLEKMI